MPDHAAEYCAADLIITESLDTTDATADFSLYGDRLPPFVAVAPNAQTAIPEIAAAVERGITDVAFFSDNVAKSGGQEIAEIVAKTQDKHRHLKYHVVCGLHPADVTPELATVLASKRFANVHFEEASDEHVLDREAYSRAIRYLREAGATVPSRVFSGFVWIGRPEERLEEIIERCLDVLQLIGTFIFKPFSPTPGSDSAIKFAKYLPGIERHEDLSPHFFPLAEMNGITREDYSDLYRLAAFLNEKVRGQSFDLLRGTLGEKFLKESLRREVWNLEPSTLSIID
jgi:hypothetical protein